jgi:hypothetical protein
MNVGVFGCKASADVEAGCRLALNNKTARTSPKIFTGETPLKYSLTAQRVSRMTSGKLQISPLRLRSGSE